MWGEVWPALIFKVSASVDLVADAVIEAAAETKKEIGSRGASAYDLIWDGG